MIIPVHGEIVSDDEAWIYDWFGIQNTCPREVRSMIDSDPDDREVTFEINSPGGSVFPGFEIYSYIRGLQARGYRTVAHVTALAASAASTIMSACERALMSPVAQVMIHQPSCGTYGNLDDHRDSLRALRSIEAGIINGYAAKCRGKTSYDELKRMVDAETWLSADQAVEIGLADGILFEDLGIDPAAVKNAAGGHSYEDLYKQYVKAVADGSTPDQRHPVADEMCPIRTPESITNAVPAVDDRWRDEARLLLAHYENDISS